VAGTGEHGVGVGKKKYLVEELGLGTVELMKKIKRTVDPLGLFNPGKVSSTLIVLETVYSLQQAVPRLIFYRFSFDSPLQYTKICTSIDAVSTVSRDVSFSNNIIAEFPEIADLTSTAEGATNAKRTLSFEMRSTGIPVRLITKDRKIENDSHLDTNVLRRSGMEKRP
jgi:hypothetical protein